MRKLCKRAVSQGNATIAHIRKYSNMFYPFHIRAAPTDRRDTTFFVAMFYLQMHNSHKFHEGERVERVSCSRCAKTIKDVKHKYDNKNQTAKRLNKIYLICVGCVQQTNADVKSIFELSLQFITISGAFV